MNFHYLALNVHILNTERLEIAYLTTCDLKNASASGASVIFKAEIFEIAYLTTCDFF